MAYQRELKDGEEVSLRRLLAVINTFQVHNPTMPIQVAATFLLVAMNEGKSLRELCELSGVAQSTMSRHLLDLSIRNRRMGPGLGLVKGETDPMELRRKCFSLSPSGHILIQSLLALMEFPNGGQGANNSEMADGLGHDAGV
jgi:DNA-binding MarR family transcriptional regulator